MTTIINLTPHDVHFYNEDGTVTTYPASGNVARATERRQLFATLSFGRINIVGHGDVEDLPPYQYGVYYIVGRLVAQTCAGRADLICPDEIVRDERGRVIGCRAWAVSC